MIPNAVPHLSNTPISAPVEAAEAEASGAPRAIVDLISTDESSASTMLTTEAVRGLDTAQSTCSTFSKRLRSASLSSKNSWGCTSDIAPAVSTANKFLDDLPIEDRRQWEEEDNKTEELPFSLQPNSVVVKESCESLYLRTEELSLSVGWQRIRDFLIVTAERATDMSILRIFRSMTSHGQTLWIASSTVNGARTLRSSVMPDSL